MIIDSAALPSIQRGRRGTVVFKSVLRTEVLMVTHDYRIT
jgi:hypothetical protein